MLIESRLDPARLAFEGEIVFRDPADGEVVPGTSFSLWVTFENGQFAPRVRLLNPKDAMEVRPNEGCPMEQFIEYAQAHKAYLSIADMYAIYCAPKEHAHLLLEEPLSKALAGIMLERFRQSYLECAGWVETDLGACLRFRLVLIDPYETLWKLEYDVPEKIARSFVRTALPAAA